MIAYYNEIDPYAAQWLRNLIAAGLIALGVVDERSIEDVRPEDLLGFTQCHFFAGIGAWSLALRNAGWPDDRPVWTGSCPCQPFSSAGKQKGKTDERHLFPVWHSLIRECRPPALFGEQVSSSIAHGWLDDVYQGLEAEGYAVGAVVFPACSVGAPHRRERLYFVAHANGAGSQGHGGFVGEHDQKGREIQNGRYTEDSFWDSGTWIDCPDGKQRLVEPSIPLLAHGASQRVGRLRAYGNAIVAQQAEAFIRASMLAIDH
jgi:DNA (cytosine-5)-methyltransferase 1